MKTDQVSESIAQLLQAVTHQEHTSAKLMAALGLSHRPTFRKNYLNSAGECK